MNITQNHPYHIVTLRPWPILLSLNLINLLITSSQLFQFTPINILNYICFIRILIIIYLWWSNVTTERYTIGDHIRLIQILIKIGIILFISSEILFFVSFFWTFLHYSLSPNIELGSTWPPLNITIINPFNVPLLNTLILLSSGVTITWAHHNLTSNKSPLLRISLTIILGTYFTYWQLIEYFHSTFRINDSSYGSIFFIATGFHGLHVLIGTLFNIIITLRIIFIHLRITHHIGFELRAWYWHFVDVVWLYLFILIYWWPYYLSNINSIINFQLICLTISLNNYNYSVFYNNNTIDFKNISNLKLIP